jgi:hypothetical protein
MKGWIDREQNNSFISSLDVEEKIILANTNIDNIV